MMSPFNVPDGLEELKSELPLITEIIARTARWVHPNTFSAFPVWYPEVARGTPSYNADYSQVYKHKQTSEKVEGNIYAQKALRYALGATDSGNWTVCHIWGIDDPKFQRPNSIVKDPRYYSCVGNMIWLPTPLKGFTDSVPEIKLMLRTCAFHVYGWVCEHEDEDTIRQATTIKNSVIPSGYPLTWPRHKGEKLPPNTAPFTEVIRDRIKKRKAEITTKLQSDSHTHYPRESVRRVLEFWRIDLDSTLT
jgi:hypothetical protein